MSVTTNVPEQQLFFFREALGRRRSRGVSQMSRNGNALPMAGEPIGRCGIVFRGFSHYSTVLRDLLVCVCACACVSMAKRPCWFVRSMGLHCARDPSFRMWRVCA